MGTLKPCCVHNKSGKASLGATAQARDHTVAGVTSHAHQDTKGKEELTGEEEEKLGGVGEEREMKRSKEAEGEKGGEAGRRQEDQE